ncbi:MAG: N-acetylmuramoyl-L-alanine amidase [Nitrospirae bacterium]|nr:N-acetylmuramoyl-L-alanine amidase [Nitrospirota bacterium]
MIHSGYKGHGGLCTGAGVKLWNHAGLCVLFIFFSSFLALLSHAADNPVEVKGLRYHVTSEYLRVVIDLSGSLDIPKATRLSGPERLFLDLKNAKLPKELQKNYPVNDPLIKSVRLGQFDASTVRIVFDLATPGYDYKIFNLEDPSRLIIDIFSKSSDKKNQEPGNIEKPAEPSGPVPNREASLIQRKIVIDAGHGGHDSGAVGPTGLREKDVVLDIALRMRSIINSQYPIYKVILTRDSDVFVPLPERAKIANKNDADFFLSVHANASPNRKARGIETYLLNWTNDEEALRVAARENAISVKRMKQVQSELGVILASLDRDRKRDGSLNLAGNIQRSLIGEIKPQYPKVADLGVKQALFYVLVDAQMPSALAEVSFISNPEEEKLLSDGAYRQKIAASLVDGINAYFSSVPQRRVVSNGMARNTDYGSYDADAGVSGVNKIKYIRNSR